MKMTRHRKSSLQTTRGSPRLQAQMHPRRATSFRHLTLLSKSTCIRERCNQVDLTSGPTLPLTYLKPRSHMDSHSDLTLPADYLWYLLLVVRVRWLVTRPLFLLLRTRKSVQTSKRIALTVSTILNTAFKGRNAVYASGKDLEFCITN